MFFPYFCNPQKWSTGPLAEGPSLAEFRQRAKLRRVAFGEIRNKPTRLHKWSACADPPAGYHAKSIQMPKVKTNSSAKKRFKVTGTGKITFQKAFKRHILTKKSKKRKRLMNKKGLVSAPNTDFVKRLLRLK
jgi:large subunit ribosomal protein L35